MLESFFLQLERFLLPEQIQVRQDTEDVSWHTARAQHIQKLHCLHLEAVVAVDHKENNVDDFRNVDHAGERVGGTFYECETPPFRRDDCDRSGGRGEGLLRVAPNERLDQCGFAYAGRANDADDDGRCFFGKAVDEGDVKALFFDLCILAWLL
jgi:hypothetical protein